MAFFSVTFQLILRADLHGTIFVASDNGLRQAHDMIYDCCVRQKERCDNCKSCRRPVVRLSHTTKIVPCKSALRKLWLIFLFRVLRRTFGTIFLLKLGVPILLYLLNRSLRHFYLRKLFICMHVSIYLFIYLFIVFINLVYTL